MNVIKEAARVCNAAERSLRELMQKAISAAEYRDLPTLAKMAEQLASLAARGIQESDITPEPAPPATAATPRLRMAPRGAAPSTPRKRKSRPQARLSSSRSAYPKFRRTNDTLIKVGWSKKAKKEYEHRAPRTAVEAVMKSVATAGVQEKVFTVDALVPVHDPKDQTEVPTYQVYLAIAWLRTEGVLRQHGREGYSLLVAENPDKTIEHRWAELPLAEGATNAGE
jgi:hypothetical protein